jgi:hypothetical protein
MREKSFCQHASREERIEFSESFGSNVIGNFSCTLCDCTKGTNLPTNPSAKQQPPLLLHNRKNSFLFEKRKKTLAIQNTESENKKMEKNCSQ